MLLIAGRRHLVRCRRMKHFTRQQQDMNAMHAHSAISGLSWDLIAYGETASLGGAAWLNSDRVSNTSRKQSTNATFWVSHVYVLNP